MPGVFRHYQVKKEQRQNPGTMLSTINRYVQWPRAHLLCIRIARKRAWFRICLPRRLSKQSGIWNLDESFGHCGDLEELPGINCTLARTSDRI